MSESRDFNPDAPIRRPDAERPAAENAFRTEAYTFNQGSDGRPGEVARTSDRVALKEQVTQKATEITADLQAAKAAMQQLNEITRAGGGPYDATTGAAYRKALSDGEKAYLAARDKADAYLFEVERGPGGAQQLKRDADGRPIESAKAKELRLERAVLTNEIEQLRGQNTDQARQLMAQKLQERNNISDLLRMSGYARANHGLGLMFACAHMREPDKDQVKFAATRLIRDANVVDPLTDQDPNFRRHEANAWKAAGGKPGDATAVVPPGDVVPPGRRPGDVPQTTTNLKDIPGVPGAKYDEVAKRLIDGPYSLPSGDKVLQVAKDEQQRVLGVDGQPVLDAQNNRRVGPDGLPVQAALVGDDPRVKVQQAEAGVTGPWKPENHTAFQAAITAADSLDRVAIARRISDNRTRLEAMPHALAYIELDNLRSGMAQLAGNLTEAQANAFTKMYTEVKTPKVQGQPNWAAMDQWLAANPAQKAVLEAHPKWADLKTVFSVFVAKDAEKNEKVRTGVWPQLAEIDLTKNAALARDVNEAREKIAENMQAAQLYVAPMSARIAYLDKLCAQDDVKQFMALPADQKLTNALKDNAQVKAAQEMMRQLATQDRTMLDNSNQQGQIFLARAGQLGITSFDRNAVPPTTTGRPVETQPQPGTGRPGDVPPTGRPGDQAAAGRPATAAKEITQDQENALGVASLARTSLLQQSEKGTKKLPPEKWGPIEAQFKKALADATSVTPEQLNAFTTELNKQYRDSLATQRNNPALTIEQANAARNQIALDLKAASDRLDGAVNALQPAEKKQQFIALQTKFEADSQAKTADVQRRLDAEIATVPAGPQAQEQKTAIVTRFQQELDRETQALANKLLEDKKAMSPEIKAAIEAQVALLGRQDVALTINYSALAEAVDKLRLAPDLVRMYYAEALAVQGENANGKKMLEDALKNPVIAALVDNTEDGAKLAEKLGVKSPGLVAMEAEVARLFPELKKTEDAIQLIEAAKGKSVDEQRAALTAASKLFDEACAMTDREGDDAKKVEDIRQSANSIKLQLELAEKAIKEGKQTDFTDVQREQFKNMQILNKQAENISLVRYRYALSLNEFGHNNNDAEAKAKAIKMLESIKDVDPVTFGGSPELQGALQQANENKKIDPKTVGAQAFFNAAQSTIVAHGSGLIDWGIPGASAAANALSGNKAASIPIVGPTLFGGGPEVHKRTVEQLAQADLANRLATEAMVNQAVKNGNTGLRDVGTDVASVLAGLGTRGLLRTETASRYLAKAGTPGKIAAFALPFAVAGLTKDATSDGQLGTGTDWLRGGGMYGGSLLVMKTLAGNPTRAALSGETLAANGSRFGVEGLAGSSQQMSKSLWAQRTALQEIVAAGTKAGADDAAKLAATEAAGKLVLLESALGSTTARIGQRFNPLNYTGLQWQNGGLRFVGFGGERTAAALGNGTMSFAEFSARRAGGNFLVVGGTAFAAGAGREGMYIGTGKTRADGTPHTMNSALKEMGGSGLQTTLATTLMLPLAGGFVRSVGGGRLLDGSGRLISTQLGRVGVTEAGVTGLANLSLVGASPVLRGVEDYNHAGQLQSAYQDARKMADEAKEKAEQELKARQANEANRRR